MIANLFILPLLAHKRYLSDNCYYDRKRVILSDNQIKSMTDNLINNIKELEKSFMEFKECLIKLSNSSKNNANSKE